MGPVCEVNPNRLHYCDEDTDIIVDRKGYHIVPVWESGEVIGQAVFINRDSVIEFNNWWANANRHWKFLIIEMCSTTRIRFIDDDSGVINKYFNKMASVRSPKKFIRYWESLKDYLHIPFSYIKPCTRMCLGRAI
jgi:hypothetical protein